jgi:hypothetical protein
MYSALWRLDAGANWAVSVLYAGDAMGEILC